MGLPGSGKGTQAEKIVQKYKIPHISTGDMFRNAIRSKTKLGLEAKSFIDKGELVPDSITDNIVYDRLKKSDTDHGFLLDGFPRNIDQANDLDKITLKLNKLIDAVIYIKVNPSDIIDRLSGRFICSNCGATYNKTYHLPKVNGVCDYCGGHNFYQREDDKPDTVKNRLNINIKLNAPLISFYKNKNILYTIDGDQPINDVFKNIDKILETFVNL